MDYCLNKKNMKIRITFLSLLAVSAAIVASAQVVEHDDMYFNCGKFSEVIIIAIDIIFPLVF